MQFEDLLENSLIKPAHYVHDPFGFSLSGSSQRDADHTFKLVRRSAVRSRRSGLPGDTGKCACFAYFGSERAEFLYGPIDYPFTSVVCASVLWIAI
jgi:hypothetical protein